MRYHCTTQLTDVLRDPYNVLSLILLQRCLFNFCCIWPKQGFLFLMRYKIESLDMYSLMTIVNEIINTIMKWWNRVRMFVIFKNFTFVGDSKKADKYKQIFFWVHFKEYLVYMWKICHIFLKFINFFRFLVLSFSIKIFFLNITNLRIEKLVITNRRSPTFCRFVIYKIAKSIEQLDEELLQVYCIYLSMAGKEYDFL